MDRRALSRMLFCATLAAAGCGGAGDQTAGTDDPFSSALGTLLDFEFDGELTSTSASNLKGQVRAQLMFTVGSINAEPGVSRLAKLQVTNLSGSWSGGLYRLRYHAKLPVAWGRKTNLPSSYTLTLPRRVDQTGQQQFMTKYGPSCSDEPGSVTLANFWYHYRPRFAGCALAPTDVVTLNASVRRSSLNTDGKYPEYHEVWQDGVLRVVSVFAKDQNGSTSTSDVGVEAFNRFLGKMRERFPQAATTPAELGDEPGPAIKDVTFKADLGNGNALSVTALLIDVPSVPDASFDKRYAELTPGADLVIYNGHAGLGANVRALSAKGKWFPETYQILFMNGCDTFAYMEDTLATARAALNPGDPTGSKYLDVVANAMPAYFSSLPDDAMTLINALVGFDAPKTWDQIFAQIDPAQVVVVTGEEDNLFGPSYDPDISWNGFSAAGEVGYRETINYQTETLQPGTYAFTMTPDPTRSSGDADLRIRVGSAAAIATKCPSYLRNSNERCKVRITAPSIVYLAATGDSTARAAFVVDGWQE